MYVNVHHALATRQLRGVKDGVIYAHAPGTALGQVLALRVHLDDSTADNVQKLRYDDSEVKKWELTTHNILHGTFGKPDGQMHENTKEFAHAYGGPLHFNMSDGELQRNHAEQTRNRKAVLESIIQQLE